MRYLLYSAQYGTCDVSIKLPDIGGPEILKARSWDLERSLDELEAHFLAAEFADFFSSQVF